MAGGKIILSLNVGATKANIKSQLDSIINGLKPKVTLDVKIKNKSEIEKLTRDVQRLNQTIAKGAGTKLNSNWGSSINTFKKAEAAMKRIEAEAKRMGITLKKSDLNAFTKAMDSRNLSGAVSAMRKMRTEIDGIKTASKAAFADFGKVNMAKGLISQVSAVKNASSELTKDSKVLQRAMSTFLNPSNTTKTRLTAFNTMEKYIQRVTSGLKLANVEIKKFASLDRQMSNMGKIVDKLNTFKKHAANMSDFTGESFNSGRIDTVISRYEKLQSVINRLKSGQKVKGWDFQSATAEAERLQRVLEKIFAGTKRRSPQAIAGLKSDINKLIFDVERLGKEWSGLFSNPKLAAGYRDLLSMSQRVTNADQLKVARKRLNEFSSEVRSAGKNTLSLGDHFKRTFKYFAMYFGASRIIYESIAAIRTMITNVAQLDSAMVELRKVSDATDLQYKEYFDRTKTSAVELGTTMHDLINATADFARLGYNLDQAESLAKTATVYQRVGDDVENIDQATQSIISTMKAFNIDAEDSMTIVDKFNEVGNNFAISSGGIGDALQRSAASMRAAGNTIDESIALVVAANNVIQDPDVVGTMWKTVSMRIRGAKTE